MSTVSGPAADVAQQVDGLEEIMRTGGEALRARMVRTELHLERVTAQAGAPLASYATATVRAGGKRLRPLLVVLAAESAGGPPAASAASTTSSGRRRLPPALTVAVACDASGAPACAVTRSS